MTHARDLNKFMLRLPEGLRDTIKVEAARNRRSMNSEIIMQLERIYAPDTETAGSAS